MRNKQQQQLHTEGYTFSGIYSSRSEEEVKARAADLRKQGIPAKVVTKRYDSRGGSGIGWSVYIKKPATPPAKAFPETVDFYWPEIKRAQHAAEARKRIEDYATIVAADLGNTIGGMAAGDRSLVANRLLAMHDAGLLDLAGKGGV